MANPPATGAAEALAGPGGLPLGRRGGPWAMGAPEVDALCVGGRGRRATLNRGQGRSLGADRRLVVGGVDTHRRRKLGSPRVEKGMLVLGHVAVDGSGRGSGGIGAGMRRRAGREKPSHAVASQRERTKKQSRIWVGTGLVDGRRQVTSDVQRSIGSRGGRPRVRSFADTYGAQAVASDRPARPGTSGASVETGKGSAGPPISKRRKRGNGRGRQTLRGWAEEVVGPNTDESETKVRPGKAQTTKHGRRERTDEPDEAVTRASPPRTTSTKTDSPPAAGTKST